MEGQVTLTVKGGRLDGTEYVFPHPTLCRVGRGFDCEVRLPGGAGFRSVSRHHCLLAVDPPRVWVWDCGSNNGTRINGMQIGRPAAWPFPAAVLAQPSAGYELQDGDDLDVGGTVFRVHVARRPADCPEHVVDMPKEKGVCVWE
jgi:pSer/pThr/pTyr-binding forkhead associated (FHA) protein